MVRLKNVNYNSIFTTNNKITELTFSQLVTDEDSDTESNSSTDSSKSIFLGLNSESEIDDGKSSSNPVTSFEF